MPKNTKISEYEREKIRKVAWSWHELRGSKPTKVELAGELLRRPTWWTIDEGGDGYPPRSVEACKRILAEMKFPVRAMTKELKDWKEEMEKIIGHLNEELDRLEIDLNKARNEYDFVAQQRDSMNSSMNNLSVYLWRMENN